MDAMLKVMVRLERLCRRNRRFLAA